MLRGWLPNGQGSEQKIKEREESKGRILGSDLRERKSKELVLLTCERVCIPFYSLTRCMRGCTDCQVSEQTVDTIMPLDVVGSS